MKSHLDSSRFSLILVGGLLGIEWILLQKLFVKKLKRLTESHCHFTKIKYKWLYNLSEVYQFGRDFQFDEIWIIAPDLSDETGNPVSEILYIVNENISRGISFTFIVPDTNSNRVIVPKLLCFFRQYETKLHIVKISHELFRLYAVANIIIFNPKMYSGQIPDVFMELPVDVIGLEKSYWAKISQNIALEYAIRFRNLTNSV